MHTDPNNPHAALAVPTPPRKALLTVTASPYGFVVEGGTLRHVIRYTDHGDLLRRLQASRDASKAMWNARAEEKTACELPKGTRGRPARIEAAEALVASLIKPDADAREGAINALTDALAGLEGDRQARLLDSLRWLAGDGQVEESRGYHRRTVSHGLFTVKVTTCGGIINEVELASDDRDIRIHVRPSFRCGLLSDEAQPGEHGDAWEVSMSSCRPRTRADMRLLSSMVSAAEDIHSDLVSHMVLGDHQVRGAGWKLLEAFNGLTQYC